MTVLIAAGGVGGIVAFLTVIVIIGRGIFHQVNATEENTAAVNNLSTEVRKLTDLYNGHETRITVLEDRGKRHVQ